jgi:hypothetical protein
MKFNYEKYPSLKEYDNLVNLTYISNTIRDAVIESSRKLWLIKNEIKSCERTLLWEAPQAATYDIKNTNGNIYIKMLFHNAHIFVEGFINNETSKYELKTKSKYPLHLYSEEKIKAWIESCIVIELFIQYAEIQTKNLKPNRQIWEGINCIYNNKTNHDITVIDSTWFTTLIKSDAFKVRGHFRLQPCGEGMKDRKLIWINEFQKEGYTREAKKLQAV